MNAFTHLFLLIAQMHIHICVYVFNQVVYIIIMISSCIHHVDVIKAIYKYNLKVFIFVFCVLFVTWYISRQASGGCDLEPRK